MHDSQSETTSAGRRTKDAPAQEGQGKRPGTEIDAPRKDRRVDCVARFFIESFPAIQTSNLLANGPNGGTLGSFRSKAARLLFDAGSISCSLIGYRPDCCVPVFHPSYNAGSDYSDRPHRHLDDLLFAGAAALPEGGGDSSAHESQLDLTGDVPEGIHAIFREDRVMTGSVNGIVSG